MCAQDLKKDRAAGIILKENNILLFHRFNEGREYWVIPGGSVEQGETPERAVDRELNEELGITVTNKEFIFSVENQGREEHHFLIKEFTGEPKLSGPEAARASDDNQYIITWVPLADVQTLKDFYPRAAVSSIVELMHS